MRPIVTDRVASLAWSVGRSVGLSAKTAAPINMPFGVRTRVSPGNHVSDGGPDPPMGRGGRPIVKYRDTLRLSAHKRLNRSRCRLGYGLGWAVGIGVQISPWERATLTLLLRNCTVDFVETCNVCARKAILKAAKRIF